MDKERFGKIFMSWLLHIIPLLIVMGLFIPVYLFSEKMYLFLFLVLVTFAVSAILDKEMKNGFIIGIITAVLLFIVNFLFWNNYVKMREVIKNMNAGAEAYPVIVGMFGEPLHPLVFLPLIILVIFGPLVVVWFVKKNRAETGQINKV